MRFTLPIIIVAASTFVVGCDQQQQGTSGSGSGTEQSLKQDKEAIEQSAKSAKEEVERQAKAQKDMLDSQAKAAQAQIDAEKARARAAGANADQKVDEAGQRIEQAAGSAAAKAQTEAGNQTSTTPTPSAPTPTADSTPTASSSDQTIKQQVESALRGDQANASAANVEVQVSGGTVTLKGNVRDAEEKSRIETQAKSVQGVSTIDNQLKVQAQ